MLDNLKKYKIILGSTSPRRQELLSGIDITFDSLQPKVDEEYPEDMKKRDIPEFLAKRNQMDVSKHHYRIIFY